MNNHSIGIFDSGLGGLTVLQQINNILPNEKLIYFGDFRQLQPTVKNNANSENGLSRSFFEKIVQSTPSPTGWF